MTPAYVLPLTCIDCGDLLDLSAGTLHDDDHTSAAASCRCGARFTVDARLLREPSHRTVGEVHAGRVDRASHAAILTNGISG